MHSLNKRLEQIRIKTREQGLTAEQLAACDSAKPSANHGPLKQNVNGNSSEHRQNHVENVDSQGHQSEIFRHQLPLQFGRQSLRGGGSSDFASKNSWDSRNNKFGSEKDELDSKSYESYQNSSHYRDKCKGGGYTSKSERTHHREENNIEKRNINGHFHHRSFELSNQDSHDSNYSLNGKEWECNPKYVAPKGHNYRPSSELSNQDSHDNNFSFNVKESDCNPKYVAPKGHNYRPSSELSNQDSHDNNYSFNVKESDCNPKYVAPKGHNYRPSSELSNQDSYDNNYSFNSKETDCNPKFVASKGHNYHPSSELSNQDSHDNNYSFNSKETECNPKYFASKGHNHRRSFELSNQDSHDKNNSFNRKESERNLKYDDYNRDSLPSTSSYQKQRKDSFWKTKRKEYTPEEEQELSVLIKDTYSCVSLDDFLEYHFSKQTSLRATLNFLSQRHTNAENDIFSHPKWSDDKIPELHALKRKLNSVKDLLSEFELNEWHKHTRSTNPADLIMQRLRSDVKVEFLTQAWCKFYEIVHQLKLIPKSARNEKKFYSIHLCEAPGAFVASLNHYLKLHHRDIDWHWMANSLNPFYEGNNLADMINDDRFMLQTINNWDFGPDLTGNILHPGYPDHLRKKCGDILPHLVTADGSFDCQDRPEEQEISVAWLHLKETLIALRVLRKGGHFVLKMFTFFECDTVCLLFLMQCAFHSIDVIKPATSKEGNSEVYVVCRDYKDDPAFLPYLRKLLDATHDDHLKFAMFPFERISRIFLKKLYESAEKFAKIQMNVIERNIRLFPRTHDSELRKQFEFMQEKVVAKFIEFYEMEPIPLDDTIVRMPYRRNNRSNYAISKVLEQRDRKQGSHNDQLKRSTLEPKELVRKVLEEIQEPLLKKKQIVTKMPKVKLNPKIINIRCGKAITAVHSSQFCHGTFIRIRNEFISAIGSDKYNLMTSDVEGSEITSRKFPDLCDFTQTCMLQKTYNSGLLECFLRLYDRLASIQENENLILFSFPLLTQFSVNILCILGQIFEEISFEPPNTLHLSKANKNQHTVWMNKLQEIRKSYVNCESDIEAVISILPIDYITGSHNSFYSWIIEVNNDRVLREIALVTYFNPI